MVLNLVSVEIQFVSKKVQSESDYWVQLEWCMALIYLHPID